MNDGAPINTPRASTDRRFLATTNEFRSSTQAFRDEALLSPLILVGRNGLRGHHIVRSPGALRLHPALNDLNLSGWLITMEIMRQDLGFTDHVAHN